MASDGVRETAKALEEGAVPFITFDDSGEKFEINEAAMEYLRSLEGRVAVVSIAGMYRTGKSYLLNMLMGRPAAFSIGSTIRACTKGIWLWSKAMPARPFKGPRPEEDPEWVAADESESAPKPGDAAAAAAAADGGVGGGSGSSPMHVLFMDTEGLGSTVRSESYDARVFALALLLSSSFVYNSVGTIDGSAVSKLSLVVQLTRHIHVRSNAGGGGQSELARFFPQFLWVVRDFGVRLERNGRRINAREYLEDALRPEEGLSESVESKNAVRALLRSFFPERDCLTMVRPVAEESQLNRLAEQPWSELRPEFRAQVEALRRKVLGGVRPKTMFGRALSGPMLASLAEAYVAALNTGGTPTISTAWERVVEKQGAAALGRAAEVYDASVGRALPSLDVGVSGGGGEDGEEEEGMEGEKRKAILTLAAAARETAPEEVVVEESDLLETHFAAAMEAKRAFAANAVQAGEGVSGEVDMELAERMEKMLWERFTKLRRENSEASERRCKAVLSALEQSIVRKDLVEACRRASSILQQRLSKKQPSTEKQQQEEPEEEEEEEGSALTSFPGVAAAYRRALEATVEAYEMAARGPRSDGVLAAFLSSTGARALADAAEAVHEASAAKEKALRRELEVVRRDLAAEAGRARAAKESLETERREFERSLADQSRAAAAKHESLHAELEARKEEIERSEKRTARLVQTFEERAHAAEDRADKAEDEADKARRALTDKFEKRADLATALAEAERRVADAQEKAATKEKEADVATERVRAAENETVRLREQTELLYEALRAAKEDVKSKAEEKEELEYEWAVAKAKVAETESERMQLEAEHTTLLLVAEAMKSRLRELRQADSFARALERVERAAYENLGNAGARK